MTPHSTPQGTSTTGHERETTTPMDDGSLLADCSCGDTYAVPQGGDERRALEIAHQLHVAAAPKWHDGWAKEGRDGDGNLILRYEPTGGLYRILPIEES